VFQNYACKAKNILRRKRKPTVCLNMLNDRRFSLVRRTTPQNLFINFVNSFLKATNDLHQSERNYSCSSYSQLQDPSHFSKVLEPLQNTIFEQNNI